MELTINHQKRIFEKWPSSLEELALNELSGKTTRGVAIAINNQVIPKSAWPSTSLDNNDVILIITATQGG